MDPKVLYWTFAFVNMGFVLGLGIYGAKQIGAGNPALHRRMMITATCLVIGFLVSYVFKVQFLGREDLSLRNPLSVTMLRFHETCVLAMVVGGGLALYWGRKLRASRAFTLNVEDPVAEPSLARRHRVAGRVALIGAVFGFLSAGFVLAGMYTRMG